MHILIVSECLPSPKYPLLGIFELDQAKALVKAGVEVTFFAIDLRTIRRRRRLGYTHGVVDNISWHSLSIPTGTFSYRLIGPVGKRALFFLFKKVFRESANPPDIIHAHFTDMGYISTYLSDKTQTPLVITEHSSAINRPNIKPTLKKYASFAYSHAKCVIAVSDSLSAMIRLNFGVNCKVIPNIIDLETFNRIKKENHRGFNIVTTSNLIPIKKTDLLIRAFAIFQSECEDAVLHIIGDGSLRKSLKDLSDNLGISNNVIFHGLKNRSEIATFYSKCDCFALVSDSETFGVAYVEAISSGLPVIATRCGGPEGFINEDNGILVDRGDVNQILKALSDIYNRRVVFNEDKIRATSLAYSDDIIAKQLINVYTEIL